MGVDILGAIRLVVRSSRWANPTTLQWKEVNKRISTDDMHSMWPMPISEAKKGRWKLDKCTNAEIKANAKSIYLDVFGHTLHHQYSFAKMLYMQFIQKEEVDLSSK